MAEAEQGRKDHIQGEILHVYDGIEEADNELPTWWLITFYGAIVFGVGYWFAFHEFDVAPLPGEEYAAALAAMPAQEVPEEDLLAAAADPSVVAEGEALFATHCEVCHRDRGQGNIGPNLTDPNWLHGGSPVDIHTSIAEGQLQNGMPAWRTTLGGEPVVQLTAFVLSIRNTNVEGKEPEGEVWGDPEPDVDDTETETDETTEGETEGETDATEAETGEVEPAAEPE